LKELLLHDSNIEIIVYNQGEMWELVEF